MTGPASARLIARGVLSAAYLAAGVLHLLTPETFVQITPAWVPRPHDVILVTGACEIAGAAGLMTRRFRRAAAAALALYAVCVFPANIGHALTNVPAVPGGWWYHAPRLLAQPLLVWWALYAGGLARGPRVR